MSSILRLILRESRACFNCSVQQQRTVKRWLMPTLKEFENRRKKLPPTPPSKRSTYLEWNYEAELFAFANRLGEQFDKSLLRLAMVQEDYTRHHAEEQAKLGITETSEPTMDHNSTLANEGRTIISQYVTGYLRYTLPRLPEEGIMTIHDHLLKEETLAHISSFIGTKELILTNECPDPSPSSLAQTFCAVVAALVKSSSEGPSKAALFIRDLVITQLSEKDVADLWAPSEPWTALETILANEKKSAPEARLAYEDGAGTLLAASCVVVFVDKKMIGKGFGENAYMARDMAAQDALRRMFGTVDSMAPLPLLPGVGPHLQETSDALKKPNLSLENWASQNIVHIS